MSYAELEQSAAGAPIELYRWVHGADAHYYTSAQEAQSYLGEDFTPAPITRGPVVQGDSIDRAALDIVVPQNHAIAALFRAGVPAAVVSLTIWRQHSSDPDSEIIVLWSGRVRRCTWSGASATLQHEPNWTSLRRPGLRRTWGRQCPYLLGEDGCGVNLAAYDVAGTAASVSGLKIECTAADAKPDGYFAGGQLVVTISGTTWRAMITRHAGKTLTLHLPLPGLAAGDALVLYPGCDHTLNGAGGCHARYANALNYGGFPFTPRLSPHGGTRLY